ncbi:DUF805 domain-containing protein [Fructilactobacillus sanfranciscensis]|uniref:DUF805 domain-containing protein n=2 Tax=Fructilactobacillus sanfranciscensis TaxID=1625 RepID=UPI0006EFA81B|nr:DUF805 domain-containing protein [Fructilactobacillus sanfranciscensis]KRM80380.1 hypothetical protein FD36_GL000273 [Fructilactobacillus sanfranciscensis DSM 20451]
MMIKAYRNFWHNIFNFSGTATRLEFFTPLIFNFGLAIIFAWIIGLTAGSVSGQFVTSVYTIVFALVWIGNLSVTVRRLHASNHSGWWFWIQFVPIVGTIWIFILMILPNTANRWAN